MYDLFYIVETHTGWYNLRLKDTHYCIACGSDLESLKRTIYSTVRRYKTEERIYSAIESLSDNGVVAKKTLEKCREDYLSGEHIVFKSLVKDVVNKALKDNREDCPFNKVKKRLKTVVKDSPKVIEEKTTTPTKVFSPRKITPRKVIRTI